MSKKENHWHLLGATAEAFSNRRLRLWPYALSAALLAVIATETGVLGLVLEHASSPAFVPVTTALTVGVAACVGLTLRRWRQASMRSRYLEALQQPEPEQLIAVITRSAKSSPLPDTDAISAHARAIAYALYGRGDDAMRALAEIDWGARAPLIQAMGLNAEGIADLICRRDPHRFLEAQKRARGLASVSSLVPGAAQSERAFDTCIALGEVISSTDSGASVKWLENSAVDKRFPALQLLASFGLAIAMERDGQGERARQLRVFLRQIAPYCTPLHLELAEFFADIPERAAVETAPVSTLLPSVATTDGVTPSAKRKVVRAVAILVGLWLALLAMVAAMSLFSSSR